MLRLLAESLAILTAPVFVAVLWLTDRHAARRRERARETADHMRLAA